MIDLTKLKKKDDDGTFREVAIMKDFQNVDNIVKLVDFYVGTQTFSVDLGIKLLKMLVERIIERFVIPI
jgi:hypothetical protein